MAGRRVSEEWPAKRARVVVWAEVEGPLVLAREVVVVAMEGQRIWVVAAAAACGRRTILRAGRRVSFWSPSPERLVRLGERMVRGLSGSYGSHGVVEIGKFGERG